MKKTALVLAFSLLISPAFAQQQDAVSRMSATVAQLLAQLERQTDEMNLLRKQLAEKDAKIKELEEKK